MTKRFEPALAPEEWRLVLRELTRIPEPAMEGQDTLPTFRAMDRIMGAVSWRSGDPHAARIAVENAALPDTDPRKITPEVIEEMRYACRGLRQILQQLHADDRDQWPDDAITHADRARQLERFADALESYLPPRGV
jgi:hypothetical protein